MTNNNEDGTPVYEVICKETRLVTINLTRSVLGGTPETAASTGHYSVDQVWNAIGRTVFVTVGPKVDVDELERLREIIQNVYNNLKYDTGNIDVLDMLREGLE